jgi:CRISPR-associated protein Cmr4
MKWDSPLDVFHAGLKMMEWLGVGGMGTRGFGRIAVVGDPLDQKFGDEVRQ